MRWQTSLGWRISRRRRVGRRLRTTCTVWLAAGAAVLIGGAGRAARADADRVVDVAWAAVDDAAARLFRQADADHSGFLTLSQFKLIEPQLNSAVEQLVRRGALWGVPPNALNAQSNGLMLPGAHEISRPEFVLEARSRATRVLRVLGPGPGPGPGMRTAGMGGGGRHGHHHGPQHRGGRMVPPPPPPMMLPGPGDTAARLGPRPSELLQ